MTTATVTGPSFLALQVRDLDAAAGFYEEQLGLTRAPQSPPGAVVFTTAPVAFAVRTPLPGTDLNSGQPGLGESRGRKCRSPDRRGVDAGCLACERSSNPAGKSRELIFGQPRKPPDRPERDDHGFHPVQHQELEGVPLPVQHASERNQVGHQADHHGKDAKGL